MQHLPDRRSIRLKEYDYSDSGMYFITICTYHQKQLFGEIHVGKMILNEFGQIAYNCWLEIPKHYPQVTPDEFIIMPNHIHGIIAITAPVGAQYLAPGPLPDSPDFIKIPDSINNNDVGAILPNDEVENETQNGVKNRAQDIAPLRGPSQTIGAIIRGYKIGVTKQIKQLSDTRCNPVWQRNYYEHIIRNMRAYENIARYIRNNPLRWQDDKYYGLNDRI